MTHFQFIFSSLILVFLSSCTTYEDPPQLTHKEFRKEHLYNIGQSTVTYFDSLRQRPLKTEIWYPVDDTTGVNISKDYPFILPPTSKDAKYLDGVFPLILLSHGTGGNRISQMWLATKLSSMGYIVVAVDHWGNTLDNIIPENFVKIWERPLDISFVLDEITNDKSLRNKIDRSRIGMIGFSLGGFTSIALAGGQIDYARLKEYSKTKEGKNEFTIPEFGNVSGLISSSIVEEGNIRYRNLKDSRISNFIALAPALGQGFHSSQQFANIENSILIIAAQNDSQTPVSSNSKHYKNLISKVKYFEIEGLAGHYVFMNQAKGPLKNKAPIIFQDEENVDRGNIHNIVSKVILEFLNNEMNL